MSPPSSPSSPFLPLPPPPPSPPPRLPHEIEVNLSNLTADSINLRIPRKHPGNATLPDRRLFKNIFWFNWIFLILLEGGGSAVMEGWGGGVKGVEGGVEGGVDIELIVIAGLRLSWGGHFLGWCNELVLVSLDVVVSWVGWGLPHHPATQPPSRPAIHPWWPPCEAATRSSRAVWNINYHPSSVGYRSENLEESQKNLEESQKSLKRILEWVPENLEECERIPKILKESRRIQKNLKESQNESLRFLIKIEKILKETPRIPGTELIHKNPEESWRIPEESQKNSRRNPEES